ncbi:P-loop containing nucleoside triphosphate hydrolase protein [Amylostereum chailletii]|nr:P-loop containing nucleoside triphosphate hydrolase protein [Amylostereum chailletii]
MTSQAGDPPDFDFLSTNGRTLASNLLKPHLDGTCAIANGTDLLALIPTGGGKTAFLFLPIFLINAIHSNSSLPPSVKDRFPKNPLVVAIFPTISLEMEKEIEFRELGLRALVINAKTLDDAHQRGEDLWETAILPSVSLLLLSPEQLISKGFGTLLDRPEFQIHIHSLGVDEIHLCNIWGPLFRKAFQQIGYLRHHLPQRTVLVALTATLLVGQRARNVLDFLGLKHGQYHRIHLSNVRPDLHLIIRTMSAGIASRQFPYLDWILAQNKKTIIFCQTILISFRVLIYLWNAYNRETLELLHQVGSELQITIATDALTQGNNTPDIWNVVIVDTVEDPDQFFQRVGRAGRNRALITEGRGIMQ